MLKGILQAIFGGGLAAQLREAYEAKLKAETDKDRIAADERISRLEAARDVRLATAGQWEMRVLVLVAGLPPSIHFGLVCSVSAFP